MTQSLFFQDMLKGNPITDLCHVFIHAKTELCAAACFFIFLHQFGNERSHLITAVSRPHQAASYRYSAREQRVDNSLKMKRIRFETPKISILG